jgi:exodeoxyribonuclease V alpha subunit
VGEGGTVIVRGTVERVTFEQPDSGWAVLRISGPEGLYTAVGNLAGLSAGEEVELQGEWTSHPRFGRQFKTTSFRTILPVTTAGMKRFLASNLVKGIGPQLAEAIVARFGQDTLRVIEQEPQRLSEVEGIGAARIAALRQAWDEQKTWRELMVFLQGLGISPGLAFKICRRYGQGAGAVVRQDPYRLAREVRGIGFATADRVASLVGVGPKATARAAAGLIHVLETALEAGHTALPHMELLTRTAELLAWQEAELIPVLEHMVQKGELRREFAALPAGPYIYLPQFARAEAQVAQRVMELLAAPPGLWHGPPQGEELSLLAALSPEQATAVRTALTERLTVITGGPGTGKTTTIRTLLQIATGRKARVLLAAPTGRAAKRLSEVTGAPASTLHRMLELRPQAPSEPGRILAAEMVIVDEMSMVDLPLCDQLLQAVQPGTHLVLVGDVDQLPPVGPGQVLKDLIDSARVPTVRLRTIFRQREASGIVTNAHRINRGQLPYWGKSAPDFFFFSAQDAETCAGIITALVTERIPRRFGIPPEQIQVLSPVHRGVAGVQSLNQRLQEALNPARPGLPQLPSGGSTFRPNDRVIQVVNNYQKEAFNGDLGCLTAVDPTARRLQVSFDGGPPVSYEATELDELMLAYAISVHKSQGSEYPAVVLPVMWIMPAMMTRRLLYTAVTRAKRLVVLVGNVGALKKHVTNDAQEIRFGHLAHRLAMVGGQ